MIMSKAIKIGKNIGCVDADTDKYEIPSIEVDNTIGCVDAGVTSSMLQDHLRNENIEHAEMKRFADVVENNKLEHAEMKRFADVVENNKLEPTKNKTKTKAKTEINENEIKIDENLFDNIKKYGITINNIETVNIILSKK